MKHIITLIVIFLIPTSVLAMELVEPTSLTEALTLILQAKSAFDSGSHTLAAVLILMCITFAIKRFFIHNEKGKELLPMLTASLGAISGVGVSVMSGQGDPLSGALGGMLLGNSASGLYDTAIKPIKRRVKRDKK